MRKGARLGNDLDMHESSRPTTSAYELPGCVGQDIVRELRERYPYQPARMLGARVSRTREGHPWRRFPRSE